MTFDERVVLHRVVYQLQKYQRVRWAADIRHVFVFITIVTGPRRTISLELKVIQVYAQTSPARNHCTFM